MRNKNFNKDNRQGAEADEAFNTRVVEENRNWEPAGPDLVERNETLKQGISFKLK